MDDRRRQYNNGLQEKNTSHKIDFITAFIILVVVIGFTVLIIYIAMLDQVRIAANAELKQCGRPSFAANGDRK